jgi:hypothetical protein
MTGEEVRRRAIVAVREILADLTDRCGLKHEWRQIEESIQDEIVASWEECVRAAFEAPASVEEGR